LAEAAVRRWLSFGPLGIIAPHYAMKRIFMSGVVLAVICAGAWAAYSVGYRRGFDRALNLQNGTFVGTFDALEKIRAGDVEDGTRRLESLCFSAADTVYSGRPGSEFVAKAFLDEFTHYRQTYRSNSAEWTVAEQNLERKLKQR
jgi:hypothetical protein